MWEKLKERWHLESNWDVFVVLVIFAITGSSSVLVRRPVFDLLGVTAETPLWLKIPLWFIVIFPAYQLLFLFWGFVLGKWQFVWLFEKKMLRRLGIKLK